MRPLPASEPPWGEMVASLLFAWAPRDLGSPREKGRERKQVSKIARTPASLPGPG